MEEKFMRLEALLTEEGKMEEIISGTAEEILSKLAGYGIEMTVEELNAAKDGFNEEMKASEELTADDLDAVAGGCKTCSDHGYATGKKVANFLRKVKNFVCFWQW